MSPGLLDPRTLRAIAADLDLRPTKQRGQNFVHDANTVRRIVATSGVGPDDVVLEVGPGLGSLTLGLLEVARAVIAVENHRRRVYRAWLACSWSRRFISTTPVLWLSSPSFLDNSAGDTGRTR